MSSENFASSLSPIFILRTSFLPSMLIAVIQRVSSGKLVYAECEDTPRLIEFYERNGFFQFGIRLLDRDEIDLKSKYLVQLFKYL